MTDVSDSKLPPNLGASGPLLTQHFGILPSQARPEQAVVGTVLVCFISRKIVNLLLLLPPVHMTRHRTKLLADIDLFVAGGMSNMLQAVPFRIAAMSTYAIIVPSIQHQRTVITKQFFVPTHLLVGL